MFWRFNLISSHIDTLLEKEDVTLQEILDEDDVLQECKAQNKRLVDFLVKQENIEELVKYVTQVPGEDVDEKIRYKYPNTACELLTSDVSPITDKLAEDEGLLSRVYGFLESASVPLNPLLASFFSRVLGILITRKSQMILEFLQAQDDFVGHLLRHIGTSAIMDLLLRLITCIEAQDTRNACVQWLNDQQLVQKLVAMIDPSQSDERHCNAAQSLCDIVRLSREQMCQQQERADPDPLLATIESKETITELLNHMFSEEKSESVLVNGLSVIQILLEFRKTGIEGGLEQMTPLDRERLAHGVSNTLLAISPRLKDFHQLLLHPPKQHYSPMPTSLGLVDVPLGNARLQVARLLTALLNTNTHAINTQLAELGTIGVILDLFFQYSWNNFLHMQVEYCIGTVLCNTMCPDDTEPEAHNSDSPNSSQDKCLDNPLLAQLFTDLKIVDRILEAWEDNDSQQSRPQGRRKGYMGHLTRIANHIVDCTEKGNNSDRIKNLISELPGEGQDRWAGFARGRLAEVNKQNTVEMVGSQNLNSSSEDDDADFRDIAFPQDSAMQQARRKARLAFTDYQLQQMTSNFIDQFGFNEDEFAEQEESVSAPFSEKISSINFDIGASQENAQGGASLFEEVVNETMQQFDDNESEEDLWEEKEITFSNTHTSTAQSTCVLGSSAVSSSQRHSSSDEDEGEEGSVGSSDSEDLSSPRVITSTPHTPPPASSSTSEHMEVDSTEQEWSNFDDMETAPVADSPSTGWAETSSSTDPAPTQNQGWADFDGAASGAGEDKTTSTTTEKWADFTNFSSIGSSTDMSSTDPGPRASSPVAMETNDVTSQAGRGAAYLAGSAPADLASTVDEVATVDSTSGALGLEDVEGETEDAVSSTTPPPLPTSQPPSLSPTHSADQLPESTVASTNHTSGVEAVRCGGDDRSTSPAKLHEHNQESEAASSTEGRPEGGTLNGPV